jgi:hypothetical protein
VKVGKNSENVLALSMEVLFLREAKNVRHLALPMIYNETVDDRTAFLAGWACNTAKRFRGWLQLELVVGAVKAVEMHGVNQ